MVLTFAIGATLAVAPLGQAQSQTTPAAPQAFEVASVKPSPPGSVQKGMSASPSEIRWRGFSLREYIFLAYGVKDYSFSGPSWLETAAFDIDAKLPAGSPSGLYPAMLQMLLAERFNLAVRREPRIVNGYVLVVDKKGLKIQPVEPGDASIATYPTRLVAKSASMTQVADILSSHFGSPVRDRTGLPGVYTFTLEWLPDDAPLTTGGPVATTIFGALGEQLGLRLESGKVPIDILVVDRIERTPTEN